MDEALEIEQIPARLAAVRERIDAACRRAGRSPAEVQLVAVSKRHSAARVAAAIEAGAREIGENYVQEAVAKHAEVAALLGPRAADARWCLIGNLQRNKARLAAPLFDCIETVDRAALASELSKRAVACGRVIDVLFQLNISGEPQKSGAEPQDVPALLEHVRELPGLRVRGLMAVPRASADPEASRAAFAQLRSLRDDWARSPGGEDLRELSMGMSADFEVAIEEGATRVRVGTAIFGERPPAPVSEKR